MIGAASKAGYDDMHPEISSLEQSNEHMDFKIYQMLILYIYWKHNQRVSQRYVSSP